VDASGIRHFPIRVEWIEFLVGLLAGVAALLADRWTHSGWLERVGRALRTAARRRALWIVVFAFLGPSIRLALIPIAPIPAPSLHDEFVNLLAADTLLQGRLANPPHAFPDHFETIYVFQKPTYSAIYPLGTAAFLAAGWKLTGNPWYGMWMAMVLCCAAVAWMLYRWLPPLAAWAGGLLFSLVFGISSYWMNSYYGGAVPAMGGALVFGALAMLTSRSVLLTLRAALVNAAILSVGWTLVWFTRPYESVIVGLIAGMAIVRALWRHRRQPPARMLGAALMVIGTAVILDFAGFCYHNWRVTGDPLLHPYLLSQRAYGVPSPLFWQKEIPEPPSLTPQQERVYRWVRTLPHRGDWRWADLKKIWALYVGYPLTIPLGVALFSASRKTRRLGLFLVACLAWSLLFPEIQPHYVAALAGVFLALASWGLLRTAHWRPGGRSWGTALAIGLFAGSALSSLRVLHAWYIYGGPAPLKPRAAIARQLESAPGTHLVFVRYGPKHNLHDEWVYNRADIDHAKVVWANDLGEERNSELIRYFAGRQVWLAEPDQGARLLRRPEGGAGRAQMP
jgi:hypothetical protein